MFSIIKSLKFAKNKKRLLSDAAAFIDQCESEGFMGGSCKEDLIEDIKTEIDRGRDEVADWDMDDADLQRVAIRMVSTHSFDLLASGRYHLGAGVLNTLGPAPSLRRVHKRALDWAYDRGLCSKQDIETDERALNQAIRSL